MKDKSLEMLEFPKIREILSNYTSFPLSRDLALNLQPSHDPQQIQLWLNQSAEARHLLSIEPDLSIGTVHDIRETVTLAARGKILEIQNLVDVQRTLTSMRYLHNRLGRLSSEAPLLSAVSSKITPLTQLEREIERCISPGAELLDSASPKLAELRRQLREKRQLILTRLDSMVKSPDNEKYIQEPLITEREGRYVIPVKIELRREFTGIVHDISNTGATAFVEPMATVDLGNELREAVIEEKQEVERILTTLSNGVGDESTAILQNLNLIAEIDLAFAKARYAETARAVEAVLCGIKGSFEPRLIRLKNARHPLLRGKPVPLNIEIGKDFQGLIITGPNTGGKTVALKTIGLLALMTQSGMPIPAAHETCLPVFDNIYADIGDEQSIEQTLSTFSWHIGNIVHILKDSTNKSLVLLDELGTSTDPTEGAALAQSILNKFVGTGTFVVATTHFSELKSFAHATSGLQNASLDFDPVTLAPTYHLTVGMPGGSNALSIASQLGIPADVISSARERLSKGSIEIEVLLSDLNQEKQKLQALQSDILKEKEQAVRLRQQLEEERTRLQEQEKNLLWETREKIVRQGDELQRQIREVMDELKKDRSKEKLEQSRKALNAVREQIKGPEWRPEGQNEAAPVFGFTIGERVVLKGMNLQGEVISNVDSSGQLEVQVGSTKLRLAPENLEKAGSPQKYNAGYGNVKRALHHKVVNRELDLRGKRADEVEVELDAYLNDASLSSLSEVRIIHGVATGTVRQIVRQFLASHPLVSYFRSGKNEEGGEGVTIVSL